MDVVGAIASDMACVACGYNLRGLGTDRACPECGHPILDTIARRAAAVSPERLRRALLATRLMMVAGILSLGIGLTLSVVRAPILAQLIGIAIWGLAVLAVILALRANVTRTAALERSLLAGMLLPLAWAAFASRRPLTLDNDIYAMIWATLDAGAVPCAAGLSFMFYAHLARIFSGLRHQTMARAAWIAGWLSMLSTVIVAVFMRGIFVFAASRVPMPRVSPPAVGYMWMVPRLTSWILGDFDLIGRRIFYFDLLFIISTAIGLLVLTRGSAVLRTSSAAHHPR